MDSRKYPGHKLRKFTDEELIWLGKVEFVRQLARPQPPGARVPEFRSLTDPGPQRKEHGPNPYMPYIPLFFNKQTNIAMNDYAAQKEETRGRTVARARQIVGLPPKGLLPMLDRLIYDYDPEDVFVELGWILPPIVVVEPVDGGL